MTQLPCPGSGVDPVAPALTLERAALHEFYAAHGADAPALAGLLLGYGQQQRPALPFLWVRPAFLAAEAGLPYGPGLAEFGLVESGLAESGLAESGILARVRDAPAALQAGLEGARTTGLGAVLIELWGEAPAYDLTASRRLALAAKTSGTPVLISRIAARPAPSAAVTRWLARAAPSRALPANAPGHPAFELALLRARNGREGFRYRVEWNRDARQFVILAANLAAPFAADDAPPGRGDAEPALSRPVAGVSARRAGAGGGAYEAGRKTG